MHFSRTAQEGDTDCVPLWHCVRRAQNGTLTDDDYVPYSFQVRVWTEWTEDWYGNEIAAPRPLRGPLRHNLNTQPPGRLFDASSGCDYILTWATQCGSAEVKIVVTALSRMAFHGSAPFMPGEVSISANTAPAL
eukprot:1665419-Amphidinium_carterae.2